MSITITDSNLLAEFERCEDVVEIKAPDGRVLGTFAIVGLGRLPPGVKSPFSDEEVAELRKQRTGRPLKDILKDLEEKYGR